MLQTRAGAKRAQRAESQLEAQADTSQRQRVWKTRKRLSAVAAHERGSEHRIEQPYIRRALGRRCTQLVPQKAPTPGGDYQSGAGLGDSRKVGLNASEETHPPSEPAVTMREETKGALT